MVDIKDLKIGNIYHISEGKRFLIFRYEKMSDEHRVLGWYVSNMDGKWKFNHSTPYVTGRNLRVATYEETLWLETCIKENKFIPLEYIKMDNIRNDYEIW